MRAMMLGAAQSHGLLSSPVVPGTRLCDRLTLPEVCSPPLGGKVHGRWLTGNELPVPMPTDSSRLGEGGE